MKIILKSFSDVNDFIKITQSFASDINIISGRYVLDGKSLLGILSLDLSKTVEVDIISDDVDEKERLFSEIEKYIVY